METREADRVIIFTIKVSVKIEMTPPAILAVNFFFFEKLVTGFCSK